MPANRTDQPDQKISYARWSKLLEHENLPVAIVDLDAFDRNARKLSLASGGKPIRLATKSLRVPALIARALASHPGFRGLMCYSAQEARFLASQGLDDFLVAYPTLQKSDLEALREIHESGKKISLIVDGAAGISALASAMHGSKKPFPVVIEIDASLRLFGGALHLGVRRSPIRNEKDLETILAEVRKHPALRAAGMMSYEAQVAGLTDCNPFKRSLNPVAWLVRITSARGISARRERFAAVFTRVAGEPEIFNGGGTGSLSFARSEKALTEVSAGSALYSPHLFDYYSNMRYEPSAFFALQIVRASDPGYVTCQGGGYVASGEPGWDRVPKPWLPESLELVSTEGCGEVQTPLRIADPAKAGELKPGAPVLFRHSKAGELTERFREVLLVQDGKIVDRVPTYRGLGLSFF